MTGPRRFAKPRLVASALEHPFRGLDMHALDHLIAETLGAALECGDQRLRALDLRRVRTECLVARRNLIGMDQALAIKPKAAAVLGFLEEPVGIIEAVEHAVEHRNAGGPSGEYDHLQ